ncbi:glycosyltransferase family 2 protein [Thermopirellula anaerolimosa]
MKIACLCATFNRPAQLAEAIESFLRQTYPAERRELVILDDAGQYDPAACEHLPGVKLITTRHRFRTLGEKRNATAALASPDAEAYAVWDDDDIYLPWHLEAMAQVFAAGSPWSRPAEVWIDRRTYLERKPTGGLFHGSWGFTREAFLSAGGYPAMQSGQDQALAGRFKRAGIRSDSPSQVLCSEPLRLSACPMPQAPRSLPSYIYRWHTYPNARHISALGEDGYQRRGEEFIERVACLTACWSHDWNALAEASWTPVA